MYKILKITLFIISFIISIYLHAQEKYEKESRISYKYVPTDAKKYIDSININSKIKWYLEENLNNKNYEAKFKRNSIKYSIEFNESGKIIDVEINIKSSQITDSIIKLINKQFKNDCNKYKILKIQIQYPGISAKLFSKIYHNTIYDTLHKNYEIVVKCKSDNEVKLYEYLYDNNGKVLIKKEIIFKNSSHLEY